MKKMTFARNFVRARKVPKVFYKTAHKGCQLSVPYTAKPLSGGLFTMVHVVRWCMLFNSVGGSISNFYVNETKNSRRNPSRSPKLVFYILLFCFALLFSIFWFSLFISLFSSASLFFFSRPGARLFPTF